MSPLPEIPKIRCQRIDELYEVNRNDAMLSNRQDIFKAMYPLPETRSV